ncbi:4'-phosphopantetheinyl transferase family protein [Desulfovibrio legallii]|uniref:4'-phosphopantetheinyl transferase n=1 Tax=Desulfovibrio legallii TaxID=571438 RepID=A0A1G7QPF1_9BACT|nr:4'-phosphopantetheinyl transferase superfamily protein [Desulfovibrio legallii]SDG00411.1 4'-phosphopantetheinyl transferase [Desulfovibrio legallii]
MELFWTYWPDLAPFAAAAAPRLTPDRRRSMARRAAPEDRLRALAAGLLLRRVLGVRADDALTLNPWGKPRLCRPGGPGFSLSHAGAYAVLAVGRPPLGVDVEPRPALGSPLPLRGLHPAERLALARSSRPANCWLRLWTGKESLLKAVGLGLWLNPESFSLLPLCDGPHPWGKRIWHLAWRELPGHVLAVAARQPLTALRLTRLAPADLLADGAAPRP